jgi:hypothetical protein
MIVIWAQIRPARAAKSTKESVVGCFMKEQLHRSRILNGVRGQSVDWITHG